MELHPSEIPQLVGGGGPHWHPSLSKVVYPPTLKNSRSGLIDVFLAGSIEMGKATDWQTELGETLSGIREVGCVYNPRRKDWDPSWKQSIDNPQFNEQVNWELDHLIKANIVFMNFIPDTYSPVTLAELGLILGMQKRPIICCPDGFWRQGNVEIMAKRASLKIFRDYEESVEFLKKQIQVHLLVN